jgi:hypothetical protein
VWRYDYVGRPEAPVHAADYACLKLLHARFPLTMKSEATACQCPDTHNTCLFRLEKYQKCHEFEFTVQKKHEFIFKLNCL